MSAVDAPDTHYAVRPDGKNIAYQVFGQGPEDLVFCWGWVSHLDLQWSNPDMARFFELLAESCRVTVFDKLGTGLSDPVDRVSTLEDRVIDVLTVMDAAGCERATIFGESEAGPTALLFANMYPRRTKGLIVYGSLANGSPDDEELVVLGITRERIERKWREMESVVTDWGKGRSLELLAPNALGVPLARRAMATYERSSVSPSMARGLIDNYKSLDVSDILHSVTVPTLVLHRAGDWIPIEFGRHLAAMIPRARFVELPGEDHMFIVGDYDLMMAETKTFVTGEAPLPATHRVLMSVLFTDIVDSTARATALGDAAWRRLLELHTEITQRMVGEQGGHFVKSTGDGILATFPGPARAIECARSLVRELQSADIPIRAGIHTGECEVIGDDIGGVAVHIGARVAALAGQGEILVSSTTKELVLGSGIEFADRGQHDLKGVPDAWRLFAVGRTSTPPRVEPAAANMTLGDRLTVKMARRMPGALRAANRLATRGAP